MKDIVGYENQYAITEDGKVWSYKTKKFLSPGKHRNGYLQVALWTNNKPKYYFIHRLVAEAFISNPNNLPQVNYKDEDKTNNNVWNLEWCDRQYNMNYGTMRERSSRKKAKEVRCVETNMTYWCAKEAERQTGIWATHILEACKNSKKTAGDHHWEYII